MQRGASLLEIAVATGICGLLLGVILTVINMTQAASIRATTNLLQSYDNAVGTFRLKYADLPGDLRPQTVSNFSFAARSGGVSNGDGNGTIEGCGGGATVLGCENVLFWRDLSQAMLLGGSPLRLAEDTPVDGTAAGFLTSDYLPISPFRGLAHFFVFAQNGQHYYHLGQFVTVGKDGVFAITGGITPKEASDIDDKIDDGFPMQGRLRSMRAPGHYDTAGVSPPTGCIDKEGGAYDTSFNTLLCQVSIRSGF